MAAAGLDRHLHEWQALKADGDGNPGMVAQAGEHRSGTWLGRDDKGCETAKRRADRTARRMIGQGLCSPPSRPHQARVPMGM